MTPTFRALALALATLTPALASAAYTPKPIESAVLEYGIREEHDALLKGDQRMLGRQMGIQRVDAEVVSQAYVKGPTTDFPAVIEESLVFQVPAGAERTQDGRVTLPGTTGVPVRVVLPEGAKPALWLVCSKLAWAEGAATLSQCQAWTPLAEAAVARLRADIAAYLAGKPVEKHVARFVVDYFVVANDMPAVSGCPDDRAACDQAIRKTDMTRAGYQAVYERLEAAGVKTGR
ncbi:MAG: hypothetical protein REJ50_01345 [Bordetella sp.]|nr:hypothetical protein [Bordetella sp.]